MYNMIDKKCYDSKNLFNYANYIIRQEFIKNRKMINIRGDLDKQLQSHELYKELGSQASQRVLFQLDKAWKSFLISIKDYSKNPSKYLGRPKLPKYKKKDGRNLVMLKNIQCRIENEYLTFSWKPLKQFNNMIKTRATGKLIQVRFVPRGNCYVMEIVYEIDVPNTKEEINNICGIDLGINNLATLTNNVGALPIIINGKPLKSINQYYNKYKAKIQSELKKKNNKDWSNKLSKLTLKRDNKIKNYLHSASKNIINYCIDLNIDTIIIGLNKTWKQESELYDSTNQNFINIPFDKFINMIKYKAENVGIKVTTTEESYTSGTSFLDSEEPIKKNYDKSRRIFRGLFKSNKGILINSDVNGSYQIIKKVVPNAFANGIEGVGLHPVIITC